MLVNEYKNNIRLYNAYLRITFGDSDKGQGALFDVREKSCPELILGLKYGMSRRKRS